MVFYAVIPNKDALHASHLSYHALKDKDALEQLGVIISYKITADYVSETPIDIEKNIENAKFLYLYPISWSKAYEEQLILRTDEGRYLPLYIINDKDRYLEEQLLLGKMIMRRLTAYGFQAINIRTFNGKTISRIR
ncbi:hypothetical protein [Rickettsia sibirica]|uniref:hypothetical protein n=1 Tax=Rickettsia sibirica TaxID=35793 RepID=UPI00031321EC|nr:hypothetical protein [Rickettsia sibirica]